MILSSGVVGSPQLLLLSGVGPREHLKEVGVPLVHHLPGVGQNLQDHIATYGNYSSELLNVFIEKNKFFILIFLFIEEVDYYRQSPWNWNKIFIV